MLVTALEKEKKRIYEEGKVEGKIEGKIEAAEEMLSEGMNISLISKITGLSEEEILELKSKPNA